MVSPILPTTTDSSGQSAIFAPPGGNLEQTVMIGCSATATVSIQASHDQQTWAVTDPATFPLAVTGNSIHFVIRVPYLRIVWSANTGNLSATFSSM